MTLQLNFAVGTRVRGHPTDGAEEDVREDMETARVTRLGTSTFTQPGQHGWAHGHCRGEHEYWSPWSHSASICFKAMPGERGSWGGLSRLSL